jgi:hypothetical protein
VTLAMVSRSGLGGAGTPGADAVQRAMDATTALVTGSAIDRLIKVAAPMTGTPAMLAAEMVLGWSLGSAAYQRWNSLMLAAPVTSALIDGGTLTPQEVTSAMAACDDLPAAWMAAMALPGFTEHLPGFVLADDAADTLWAGYSKPGTTGGAFDDRDQITTGLTSLRREILAGRLARDITEDAIKPVFAALANTADAALQITTDITAAGLLQAARSASKASAAAALPDATRAAFDALLVLVSIARRDKVDLPTTLAEVQA